MTITYEDDKSGRHKVITQDNGIQVRLLQEPSKWYRDKMAARAVIENEKRALQEVEQRKQAIIKERYEKLAVDELKREGILNTDGSLNE